ncbi:MAG: nucleotidyltransferase family protein [Methyloversatilis sp.]|uniref:nucleotidyltransferase family protein n=1 Tax=Methyloversatilis sp. TaxID=2569862 RepID=UPI0027371E0F|nr:nucleotidyltransferase family protein [Methyloversatilis sp.]MDP3874814.1 nucleotidyltransferase family protein [Methyloversatilis sp.]
MQGILLAAGYGRRFDPSGQTSKLLARLSDGQTVAAQAARTLCAALPGSLAVIRPGQTELAAQLREAGCHILESSEAEAGMGSALAHAVRATATAEGWLLALADMPWVPVAAILAVASAIDTPNRIAAAAFDGQRGHPVAFGAHWAPQLSVLNGDRGARDLLRGPDLRLIDAGTADVLRDIDLPADLPR